MNGKPDDRPLDREETEYHIVRPEQERSAYSDAYYRSAPREGGPHYGYNPSRYYAGPDGSPGHRGQIGLKGTLALCMVCVFVAGVLGVGGLYLLTRDRQRARAADQTRDAALYAEAPEDSDLAGPLATAPVPEGAQPMSGEDIYAMACGQVVGVAAAGAQGGSLSGSGIIISDDGYILTNYHIIQTGVLRGWPIAVDSFTGQRYDAQIVGAEPESDLAVLKIEAQDLPAATLGDSEALTVGQRVYAVGNPLGALPCTMTRGVVSARDRRITVAENTLSNMFQFDAPVNEGNSGGPVYNVYGQVVGVATAKYAASGVEGLGFAIPISDAADIANQLITKGYVSGKAYLGLVLDTVTPSVSRYFGLPTGAYIRAVEPDSAAAEAGLLPGDVITAVDETPITGADALVTAVRQGYRAGDAATLTVSRGGESITVSVTFGEATG